jgi:hypothetical protein
MNESPTIGSVRLEERPPDERFVRRVVAALVADRRRRRRLRLAAAAALLFFFFAGAGQRAFTASGTTADAAYAGLLTPSPLDGFLPE